MVGISRRARALLDVLALTLVLVSSTTPAGAHGDRPRSRDPNNSHARRGWASVDDARRYGRVVMNDLPIAYYALGEPSGHDAVDGSTYGRTGTYGANVALGERGAIADDPDTSVRFSRNTDEVATNFRRNFRSAFSLEAWIGPTVTTSTSEVIVSKSRNGPTASDFTTSLVYTAGSGGVRFNLGTASTSKAIDYTLASGSSLASGWHHVVATYRHGSKGCLYVDGLKRCKALNFTVASNARNWTLGRHPAKTSSGTWEAFEGRLDEVAIYDRVLPGDRVRTHFQAGKSIRLTRPKFFLRSEMKSGSAGTQVEIYVDRLLLGTLTTTRPGGFRNQSIELVGFSPFGPGASTLVQWRRVLGDDTVGLRYLRIVGDKGAVWGDQYQSSAAAIATDGPGDADAMQPAGSGSPMPSGVFDDHIVGEGVGRFVAMGDSYQSGVGAGGYLPGTDTDGPPPNHCKRSLLSHIGRLANDEPIIGMQRLEYVACGGAEIADLYQDGTPPYNVPDDAPYDEDPQVDQLGPGVLFASLGIGGNDLQFSEIIKDCDLNGPFNPPGYCQQKWDPVVRRDLSRITTPVNGFTALETAYRHLLFDAPNAVERWGFGYPRFYPAADADSLSSCEGISRTDQLWINQTILDLDSAIRDTVTSLAGMRYIDLYSASVGHELCNQRSSTPYLHGATVPTGDSYHPTAFGYRRNERLIRLAFDPIGTIFYPRTARGFGSRELHVTDRPQTVTLVVRPRQELLRIAADSIAAAPLLTVVNPADRVLATGAGGAQRTTSTDEVVWAVERPAPGRWRVTVESPAGVAEQDVVLTHRTIRRDVDPVAKISVVRVDHNTFRFHARGSYDPDGRIVGYVWDTGDRTGKSGVSIEESFEAPGRHRVNVAACDGGGRCGFTTSRWFNVT
jgi:Concanavalin A-like lectin/glucanases superfamily/PKD domain